MKLKKFLKTLDSYYSHGLGNYYVKFYAQAQSFSFEVHDKDKRCVTSQSVTYQSDIYYDWIDNKETRKEIIQDIIDECDMGNPEHSSDIKDKE